LSYFRSGAAAGSVDRPAPVSSKREEHHANEKYKGEISGHPDAVVNTFEGPTALLKRHLTRELNHRAGEASFAAAIALLQRWVGASWNC
jgi:hypothetical protein